MLNKINSFRVILGACIMSLVMYSCSESPAPQVKQPNATENTGGSLDSTKLKQLKKIFFSIPSPVEMASVIEQNGYKFDASKLNPAGNVDKYTGEIKQAVNLGIYGADLSYASIFDQKQVTLEYFAAAQKLSKNLGIQEAIDSKLIESMDKNQNNRDSMLNVITTAYADLTDYLKENQRVELSALMIAGGWIEALYIVTHYAGDGRPELRQRIAEQKYALNDLLLYMEKFGDIERLKEIKADLVSVHQLYSGITETPGKTTTSKDKDGTLVISGGPTLSIDDATLKAISTKAVELRNKYTSI